MISVTEPVAKRPGRAGTFAALLRADFIAITHSAVVLMLNFIVPVFIVVLLGRRGTSSALAGAIGGDAFAIALALTIGLMTSSLFGYSIALARDREAGVFQRLRLTPTPTWQIMGSRLLLQLVADLVMTVIVVIVATALHHAAFGAGQLLLLLGVSVLGGAMFLALAQALVALVRSAAVVSAVSRFAYIVLLLLGLIGVSGALGPTVQAVGEWTPVGALIDAYAGAVGLTSWGWRGTAGVIAIVVYGVVGVFVGVRWFSWSTR